jgi:hypothetical protein
VSIGRFPFDRANRNLFFGNSDRLIASTWDDPIRKRQNCQHVFVSQYTGTLSPNRKQAEEVWMHTLDLFTILCVRLMTGNELAVSFFVNPAISKLDEPAPAQALSKLARSFETVMPIWYALSLFLLIAEAYVRRNGPHIHLLHGAVVLWIVAIVYTVSTLVPINNRIARLDLTSPPQGWSKEHRKWDKLHRSPVAMLAIATASLVSSIVSVL